MREKEFISLKEAAKMSGYSADYIGQLIRSGKLPGKQVFSNVSWVTTEDALLEYLQKEKGSKNQPMAATGFVDAVLNPEVLTRVYPFVAWIAIGICGLFILLLMYVFSVSIDHRINQTYIERLEVQS